MAKDDGFKLSREDIITLLDFFQHQYVHYDNVLLINLLRKIEKKLKDIDSTVTKSEPEDKPLETTNEISQRD